MVRIGQEKQDMTMSFKSEAAREMQHKRNLMRLFLVGLIAYISGFSHGASSYGSRRASCEECNNVEPTGGGQLVGYEDGYNRMDRKEDLLMDSTPSEKYMIKPFERTPTREYLPGHKTDTYTFFHNYVKLFGGQVKNDTSVSQKQLRTKTSPELDIPGFPLLHIWPNFFEAYHNHWQRFRGRDQIVFMEIGVQSGGKVAMLREYFGPGLVYIGVDVNPSCKMFESAEDRVHIEIGDAGEREFLESLKLKYPHVDLFLDDGGHSMHQQKLAMEVMLPHIANDGVYACEDLNTSWNSLSIYGGKRMADHRDEYFREETMMGLVHRTIDWLHYGWLTGRTGQMDDASMMDGFWPETWWKDFAQSVKHIHVYNQIVFYEKGQVEVFQTKTMGYQLPHRDSGEHEKVDWKKVSSAISSYTGTKHEWN